MTAASQCGLQRLCSPPCSTPQHCAPFPVGQRRLRPGALGRTMASGQVRALYSSWLLNLGHTSTWEHEAGGLARDPWTKERVITSWRGRPTRGLSQKLCRCFSWQPGVRITAYSEGSGWKGRGDAGSSCQCPRAGSSEWERDPSARDSQQRQVSKTALAEALGPFPKLW